MQRGGEETSLPYKPLRWGSDSDEDKGEEHSDDEELVHAVGRVPLALALTLKFAGDEVSFVRCG